MPSLLQRFHRRLATIKAFSATGESVSDKLALAFAGLARNRPFAGESAYARLCRKICSEVSPKISSISGQKISLDLQRLEETLIFEELFIDRTYPIEKVPFAPDVVIDCGAFCGMFTLLARSRFPTARFIAIEPEPHNFARTAHNFSINQANVETINAAVGVIDGTMRFSGDGFGGHIVEGDEQNSIEVRVISLAALLTKLKPERLVLKLDVEGAEKEILPAILPLLPKDTVIFLETHHPKNECDAYLSPYENNGFKHELVRNRDPNDVSSIFLERLLVRHQPVVRHFCTYFDINYSAMGLALYRSLRRHCPSAQLWALCIDDACYELCTRIALPGLKPIRMVDFERGDDALLAAKKNRSNLEYYFTCTPSLPLYVLRQNPEIDIITYLDSDLYFFGDPDIIFARLGRGSIGIIEHRYSPQLDHLRENGIYNVGWLSFRNDDNGLACLRWWRERCLEWCYMRHDNNRYADQKYLDDWTTRFANVVVIPEKGANLAVWNLANYKVSAQGQPGKIMVDDEPLIFFHFHGLRRPRPWLISLSTGYYGVTATRALLWEIFIPFVREVVSVERNYGAIGLPGRRFTAHLADSSLTVMQKLRLTGSILAALFRRHTVIVVRGSVLGLP